MVELREFLQRKHMMDILLAVYQSPGSTQPELIEGDGRNTKFKRLTELCDKGFVAAKVSSLPRRNTIVYYVTDEGEKHARNIAALMEGRDPLNETNHRAPSEQGDLVNGKNT
jgi:hypothetical protein